MLINSTYQSFLFRFEFFPYILLKISIDPNKVRIFQKTYMEMLDGDSGYGTFGPKTTAKWKEVIYDQKTYENLYEEAISLKDDGDFMNSNKLLHYIIDAPNAILVIAFCLINNL